MSEYQQNPILASFKHLSFRANSPSCLITIKNINDV